MGLKYPILVISMRSESSSKKTKLRFGGAFCLLKIAELVFNRRNGFYRIQNRRIKTSNAILYHWSDIVTFILDI